MSKFPEDRIRLGELWAEAVADVDDAEDTLARARKREAEVWAALERSRSQTVAPGSSSRTAARRKP